MVDQSKQRSLGVFLSRCFPDNFVALIIGRLVVLFFVVVKTIDIYFIGQVRPIHAGLFKFKYPCRHVEIEILVFSLLVKCVIDLQPLIQVVASQAYDRSQAVHAVDMEVTDDASPFLQPLLRRLGLVTKYPDCRIRVGGLDIGPRLLAVGDGQPEPLFLAAAEFHETARAVCLRVDDRNDQVWPESADEIALVRSE